VSDDGSQEAKRREEEIAEEAEMSEEEKTEESQKSGEEMAAEPTGGDRDMVGSRQSRAGARQNKRKKEEHHLEHEFWLAEER
jgi:hypothetical protein